MARMVATKAALSIRVDALTDADGKSEPQAPSIGIENRAKLESRLRALEHEAASNGVRRFQGNGKKQQRFEMTGETKVYNTTTDVVDLVPTQREPIEIAVKAVLDVKEEKRKAKEERKAKKRAEKEVRGSATGGDDTAMEVDEVGESAKDKKRKRRDSQANGDAGKAKVSIFFFESWFVRPDSVQVEETEEERKARKKARKAEKAAAAAANSNVSPTSDAVPKKKKRKSETLE
jgi:nucleolar protein 58